MPKTFTLCCAALVLLASCASKPVGSTDSERRADIYAHAGIDDLRRKDYTSALRNFLDSIKQNPKSPSTWTNIGIAYAGKNEIGKAEESWRKALQLDSTHNDARLNLGILYIQKKKYPEAERVLKEAAKDLSYSKTDQVALQLAQLYTAQARPLQAEQQLKIAVRENSTNCNAWLRLGMLQKERGDYVEAAQSLKGSVMGTCYKNPKSHYEIATLFLKAQDYQKAKTKLLEIIQLFPTSEWAQRSEATLNMIR